MNGQEWQKQAAERLERAGCSDALFDARCLLEDIGGLPRGGEAKRHVLPREREEALSLALCEREKGRPLQYILGKWDFLSLTLAVGEGVLIPRPETELLCETAARLLADTAAPQVLDLCAGSGCVGLGVASLKPDVSVTALELSEEALVFLRRNCETYAKYDVTVKQADVLKGAPANGVLYDAILSNPPYIPTVELAGLQREVQREPRMALDGQEDGLLFYRAICERWLSCLKPHGFAAVEVGYDQAEIVARMFTQYGLSCVTVEKDFADIGRVVWGRK